jgi:hypothetical protein
MRGLNVIPKATHVSITTEQPLYSNAKSHMLFEPQFQTNYYGSLASTN